MRYDELVSVGDVKIPKEQANFLFQIPDLDDGFRDRGAITLAPKGDPSGLWKIRMEWKAPKTSPIIIKEVKIEPIDPTRPEGWRNLRISLELNREPWDHVKRIMRGFSNAGGNVNFDHNHANHFYVCEYIRVLKKRSFGIVFENRNVGEQETYVFDVTGYISQIIDRGEP